MTPEPVEVNLTSRHCVDVTWNAFILYAVMHYPCAQNSTSISAKNYSIMFDNLGTATRIHTL